MTSNKPATVFISLGSNIEPNSNLIKAVSLLEQSCQLETISSAYITPPQGFTEQEFFWNVAVKIMTDMTPITLKHEVLDVIEQKLKRVRDPQNKNAPRTIDLDISLWNEDVFDYGEKPWHIPDPDILRFAHVVIPLAEIAPDYVHPVEKATLAEIAAHHDISELHFSKKTDWYAG
jgi:2-amino-4-hydroxy-6-hydroxymethyldihydropteridine diphosphokinase